MNVSWWRSQFTTQTLYILLLRQLIFFLFALAGFTSSFIAKIGMDAPLSQMLFSYAALALIYCTIMVYSQQGLPVYVDHKRLDASVLYNCVMPLVFIETRCSTLYGSCSVQHSPLSASESSCFQTPMWVEEEFYVKKKDRFELLSMLGTFGFLVSVVEMSILERDDITSIKWSTEMVLALVGFAFSCIAVYSLTPFLLKMSGAALYNLSAITAGLWTVVVRIFIYDQEVDWLYYFAFAMIIIGIVICSTSEKDADHPTVLDGNTDQYKELHGENGMPPQTPNRVTTSDELG